MTMKVLDSLPASLDEVPTPWRYAGAGVLVVAGLTLASQVEQLVRRAVVSRRRKAVRQQIRRDKEEFAREIRRKQPGDSHERICALSLQDLQKELQQETLTPSQVLLAYWRKAVDLDDKTNCVAAYIKEAENWAKQLDKAKEKGPLYGIPISVKEIHAFKGYPIAMGVYNRMGQQAQETFVPYKVMQNQGAIPFVTSNSPYLGLSYTCWNPLNDDGRNPLDLTRQPGGSSGGEGALVAGGASVLGFGSDVAGSIRCPSSWCGIVGLKCCSMRLSARGNLFDDNTLLPTTYGPMVRDVDSAAFVMRHLLVEDMWKMDGVAPLPWRDEIYRDRRPLRIGFYANNGQFRAAPCMERAVRLAKEKLEAKGHTLVPFEIPPDDGSGDWTYMEMIHRLLRGDGGKTDLGFMGNDLPGRYLVMATKPFQNMPRWLNILVSKLMKAFSRRKGDRMEYGCGAKDVYDWWGLTLKITAWRRHTLDAFHGAGLDAVLCPAFSAPAMPMDQMWPIDDLGSYTFVYNLLDWAGGVVPVTKVTEADIADMKDYPKEEPFYSLIQKGMEGAVGLPVAVQVAVPPFQEELCLRVLKQLEDASK